MSEKLSNNIISNRKSSGIKGLDDMIGGGFPEGHIVVVIGESGVGKTTFAMQFIMDGLVKKEPAIYISIEEEKESLIASARVYGWDMEKYIKDNKLAILNLDLSDIKTTSRKIKTELPEFIESFGAKRMVIDSITLFSIMFDDVIERRIRLAGLIKAIRKVGITSLFTAEVNTDSTQHSKDGIIDYQFALSLNGSSIIPGDDNPSYDDAITDVRPIPGIGMVESRKYFRKYVVVSDPDGITNIAKVFEQLRDQTDGIMSGKSEVEATDITSDVSQWTAAINQAYIIGVITAVDKDEMLYGLQADPGVYKIFAIDNFLTNHDPPGDYNVYFKVVTNVGTYKTNDGNRLKVRYLSYKVFELDFNTVNYGSVIINQRKLVSGDKDLSTPDKPTIKNQGNVNIQMQASASDLVSASYPVQTIPASALGIHSLGFSIISLSNTPQVLENPFVPGSPEQIDFDITPPNGTISNTYSGTFVLEMAPQ